MPTPTLVRRSICAVRSHSTLSGVAADQMVNLDTTVS